MILNMGPIYVYAHEIGQYEYKLDITYMRPNKFKYLFGWVGTDKCLIIQIGGKIFRDYKLIWSSSVGRASRC